MSTEVSAQPSISNSIVEVETTSEDSLFKLQRPPSLGPDVDLEEPEPETDDKLMMTEYDEDNVIVIDLTEEKRNSASLKKSKSEDIAGVLDQDEPSMPRPFFDLSDLNGGGDNNENHKGNQMRSPLRPKIGIFNIEELRDVESKNILSKSRRNNQYLKLLQ